MLYRTKVLRSLLLIFLIYVLTLSYFFVAQRSMIYEPTKGGAGLASYWSQGEMKEVKEVTIETSDGVKLQAWYRQPDIGYDMVLFLHGNSGNLEKRAAKLQVLADMGYGFLIPSWRGFGNSTGYPDSKGINLDTQAAVNFLQHRGYDPAKVVLVGESLGSGPAVQIARTHEFKGVLLITPYTSLHNRGSEMYPYLPIHSLMSDDFDNISHIQEIRSPILIIHGTNDDMIPHGHAEQLIEKANEPKKLVLYPGKGHSNYDVVAVFGEMRNFFGMANNHKEIVYHQNMELNVKHALNIVSKAEANLEPIKDESKVSTGEDKEQGTLNSTSNEPATH